MQSFRATAILLILQLLKMEHSVSVYKSFGLLPLQNKVQSPMKYECNRKALEWPWPRPPSNIMTTTEIQAIYGLFSSLTLAIIKKHSMNLDPVLLSKQAKHNFLATFPTNVRKSYGIMKETVWIMKVCWWLQNIVSLISWLLTFLTKCTDAGKNLIFFYGFKSPTKSYLMKH